MMKNLIAVSIVFLAVSLVVPVGFAQIDLTIVPNHPYHQDGDPFSIVCEMENPGAARTVDFYFVMEIAGLYYFYPSFGQGLDGMSLTIPSTSGNVYTHAVIPEVILPDNLPAVSAILYAVCTEPGTFDLLSNLDIQSVHLQGSWDELPFPNIENTFYFMPGDSSIDFQSDQSLYNTFSYDIHTHFPLKGLYMRHGITLIDYVADAESESKAIQGAQRATAASLAVGFHVGITPHHLSGSLEALRQTDRRYNQWEPDGSFYNEQETDLAAITMSRYATELVDTRKNLIGISGEGFFDALQTYPQNTVFINGPIEVEMRRSGNEDPHYADYSPFAIREFCDWLRHSGMYQDAMGQFAGQGVPLDLISGHDFSNDASPGDGFNAYFGTNFTTWDLLYWDLVTYPDPLANSANAMPGPGQTGHTAGGFDAPRMVNDELVGGNVQFQEIWDGWRSDNTTGIQYGYGFRQSTVYNYVADTSKWFFDNGVPRKRNFTHQIPSDFLNNWIRNRGAASPFWTAINPYSCAGYTAYWETTQSETLFQLSHDYSPRWGIFEYHPDPETTQSQSYFLSSLEKIYQYRGQIVVPLYLYQSVNGNYKLIGTPFADAVRSFIDAKWPGTDSNRFDQPYFNSAWINYLPPDVQDVTFNNGTLTWSNTMWQDRPDLTWDRWGEFDHFNIYRGDASTFEPNPANFVMTTTGYAATGLAPGNYKVLAVSEIGVTSPVE